MQGGINLNLEKHLIITGSSPISWDDAIESTIKEASKSIDYLSGFSVLNKKGIIDGTEITQYIVDLDISFTIDLNRR